MDTSPPRYLSLLVACFHDVTHRGHLELEPGNSSDAALSNGGYTGLNNSDA